MAPDSSTARNLTQIPAGADTHRPTADPASAGARVGGTAPLCRLRMSSVRASARLMGAPFLSHNKCCYNPGMMDGNRLRALREQRGWTQRETAKRLRVTQAYLSMLESGRRPSPARLLHVLAHVFDLPATALPLPPVAGEMSDSQLAEALAALRYPGFRHLASHSGPMRNPADVLAAALCAPRLDARVVEALPWLALEYSDLDWNWLVREAKLRDLQNRLGYVVLLAHKLADKLHRPEAARQLREVEQVLEESRLAREGSLAGDALSEAERQWLRERRPSEATHWNLLTELTVEQLQHVS